MGWISALYQAMTSLTQAEVLIALVVAAHAGVLAVRLAASLYRA
jgi:photosystem I subunit XII